MWIQTQNPKHQPINLSLIETFLMKCRGSNTQPDYTIWFIGPQHNYEWKFGGNRAQRDKAYKDILDKIK